jgi:hypothetical protein
VLYRGTTAGGLLDGRVYRVAYLSATTLALRR